MKHLLSILLLLALPLTSLAQIDSKVLSGYKGIKNPQLIGDIVVGEVEGEITPVTVAVITVTTKASNIEFSASDINRRESSWFSLPEVTDGEQRTVRYVVTTPGENWIEALCIDFDKKVFNKYKTTVTIGKPKPPTPPDPPKPDVPPDVFNNIGQKVAEWTKGLPDTKLVGKVYLDASKDLRTNPSLTINQAANNLVTKLLAIPSYVSVYNIFKTNVNADVASRGTMTKGVLADYWKCIALGLGVAE